MTVIQVVVPKMGTDPELNCACFVAQPHQDAQSRLDCPANNVDSAFSVC